MHLVMPISALKLENLSSHIDVQTYAEPNLNRWPFDLQ